MSVPGSDRIEMSQRERDILKVLHSVMSGERTQAEAASLLQLCVRQLPVRKPYRNKSLP